MHVASNRSELDCWRRGEERRGKQSSSPVRSPVPAFPCMAGLGRGEEEESAAIEHEESDTRNHN